jgi:hypothetical protein
MKKIFHYIPLFLLTLAVTVMASCSDTIEDAAPVTPQYTGVALSVAIPQGSSSASMAMNATTEELQADNLWVFCFPVNGNGTFLSQELSSLTTATSIDGVKTYPLILKPGEYNIYVIANLGSQIADKDGNTYDPSSTTLTETQLNSAVLNYDAGSLPTAGKIPMVFQSKGAVTVYDGKATPLAANLTFTCAKVVLNIIFDPDNIATKTGNTEGGKALASFPSPLGYKLTSITGNNITAKTNLMSAPETLYDDALGSLNLMTGKYYNGYTYTSGNAGVSNANVVEPVGDGVDTPTDTRKWLYRATYYLPERDASEAKDATSIPISGELLNGATAKNTYENISGDKLQHLERGKYYEIVSVVNGLGKLDLNTNINVEDWTPVPISADFWHTELWVSETKPTVTTDKNAVVNYKTNAETMSAGCDTKITYTENGKEVTKDIIVPTLDMTKNTLTLAINPDIPMKVLTDLNKAVGTAKVYLKANNIKKYLDVKYTATPYLTVTPQEEVIYWTNDAKEASTLVKTLTFKTNLGGIQFQASDFYTSNGNTTGGVLSHGKDKSRVLVNCTSNTGATGTITVTAKDDPVTTTEHTFTVLPLTAGYEGYAKEVKVTVKPAKGNYRIYMRAINDLQWYNSGASSNEWSASDYQPEDDKLGTSGSGNWRDGWKATYDNGKKAYVGNWDNVASEDNHYAYIYTQIGETETTSTDLPVWRFTPNYPGSKLTADGNNPGWYYITKSPNDKQLSKDNGASEDKYITPGQTLIIFSNNTNISQGYTLHRFTHHLDPGIPLFNYDDKEGWYLYDPTSDPYYRVFDDKPKVEDITYVIYTSQQVTGWYHYYGVGANTNNPNTNQMFNIHSNSVTFEKKDSWYITTLKFKCAHGYYDKAIQLKGITGEPLLFGGENWTPTNGTITGYYVNGKWYKENPNSSAKRRR